MFKRKVSSSTSSSNNKKQNIEQVDSTALWVAIDNQNFYLAKKLIKNIADIHATAQEGAYKGVSILWLAVFFNEWDFANSLILNGADTNATAQCGPYQGMSVLWIIMINKKWELAQLLITKGANINAVAKDCNNNGKSILWVALYYKQFNFAKDLIIMGADINATVQDGPEEGISVLWIAAYFKQWDLANIIISKGAEVNAVARRGANKGKSILYFAAQDQEVSLAKKLINLGANLDIGVALLENRLILKSLLKFPENIIEAIVYGKMSGVDEGHFCDIKNYFCAISKELILYPVIMQDGCAYNLTEIHKYIESLEDSLAHTFTSPLTGKQISKDIPQMSALMANIIAKSIELLGNKLLQICYTNKVNASEYLIRQDSMQLNSNTIFRIKRRCTI